MPEWFRTRSGTPGRALACFSLALLACSGSASPNVGSDSNGGQSGGSAGNGNGTSGGSGRSPGSGTGTSGGSGSGASSADGGAASGGGPSNGSGSTTGPQLFLWSTSVNGGFDGQHPFLIPTSAVLVQGTDATATPSPFAHPPTFAVADTSIATVAAAPTPNIPSAQSDPFFTASAYALITPKAAGTTTLTVTYDTQSVQAKLYITAYTPADVALGQTRYTNPATPGAKRLACAGCHAAGNDAGLGAPVHDPFFQQDLTDSGLLVIIEKGLYDVNDPTSTLNVPGGHTWNLTADEEKGIPAYLRSIPPTGF